MRDLADRLGQLARSRELRNEMGEKARKRALNFTAEKFVEKALPFYNRFAPAASGK